MAEITKVALDAMGGDNAPGEIVKGAVEAVAKESSIHVFLVGKEEILKESASAQDFLSRILGGNQQKSMRNA